MLFALRLTFQKEVLQRQRPWEPLLEDGRRAHN